MLPLAQAMKLQPGDYGELVKALKKVQHHTSQLAGSRGRSTARSPLGVVKVQLGLCWGRQLGLCWVRSGIAMALGLLVDY